MRRASFAVLSALLLACGGSGTGGGSGSDGGGGGGGGDGGSGGCTNATQCDGQQVCNPDTGECEAGGPCDAHGDCGPGAYCPDGTCAPNETGGPCDGDGNCPAGDTCIDGFCGCEGEAFAAEPVVPNVMIVLDKSGSMTEDLDGDCPRLDNSGDCVYPPDSGTQDNPAFDGPPDKWQVATDAMSQILTSHGPKVRFGLVTFATGSMCGTGGVRVPIGPSTETEIQTFIDGVNPIGATPIGATLNALVGNPGLDDTNHTNYVLLVTDGQDTCGGNASGAARNLFQQTPSVKTFVVGFGGGVDAGELNDTAVQGGTARPGPTKYYQADNAAELQAALDSILGSVLSCQYQLDQVPEDLADLYVYADGTLVDRDPSQSEGWDYDPASGTITFYGQVCRDLQNGTITDLNIVYGCPDPDVE
ncbi:MAG TPA: VWA domain-containing protein [Kofleriaceae bacterium]|nr:VWA domain-containing protein [Kofleriaceae bacterium]